MAVATKIKRKLPPPSFGSSIGSESKPQNDTSLHQGRKRIKPHVEGDWPTHIFVSINLPSKVKKILKEIVEKSIQQDPKRSWHSSPELQSHDATLHLSLSRPIFLKTNERHKFVEQLQQAIIGIKSFEIYFATLSTFLNDDCSRGFLALEVGSGHSSLKALLDQIDTVVESFLQSKYYNSPRFHASIAWCLMNQQSCSEVVLDNDVVSNLLTQNVNEGLDEIRRTCWKIQNLNVLIGKSNHQLPLVVI